MALCERIKISFSAKPPKIGGLKMKFSNPHDEAFGLRKRRVFKRFRGFRRRRNSNLPQFYHSSLRFSQIKDTVAQAAVFFLCRTLSKVPPADEVFLRGWIEIFGAKKIGSHLHFVGGSLLFSRTNHSYDPTVSVLLFSCSSGTNSITLMNGRFNTPTGLM